jgi:serine/threonine protein kinase
MTVHPSGAETLESRLQKGPLPVEQTLRTASEIASALDAAHRKGIIHRDLKSGNIMMTRAGSKLIRPSSARTSPRRRNFFARRGSYPSDFSAGSGNESPFDTAT